MQGGCFPLRHTAEHTGDPLGSVHHLVWLQAFIAATQMELQLGYLEAWLAAVTACQHRACEEPPLQQCGYAAHNSELSTTSDVCCVHSAARDAFCQVDRFWPASQVPYKRAWVCVPVSLCESVCACVCLGRVSLTKTYRSNTTGINSVAGPMYQAKTWYITTCLLTLFSPLFLHGSLHHRLLMCRCC